MIGKIERVPLREVWRHEALDLTRWLQTNIDVLGDAIDLTLTNAEREQQAGDFSVDLVVEEQSGATVIVENQLTRSDHDHLGKLLTYLVAYEAKAAVWIVAEPRPEHVSAIAWLNESATADFYLLKLEAIRIGESPPAALLTRIVGPSEEAKEVGRTKQELAGRQALRKRYWTELLEQAQEASRLHSGVSAGPYSYLGTGAGLAGLSFNYVIRQRDNAVELYIDRGKAGDEENREIFARLLEQRAEIEERFGTQLEWDATEGRRACRIRYTLRGGYRDEDEWDTIHARAVDSMVRLEAALRPHLESLRTYLS